jgi:hypothetical protein
MSKGGARKNAGRPRLSTEEKESRAEERATERRAALVDELLFPALCNAFNANPGHFKNHYLTVELSKRDIEQAYGRHGMAAWLSFFTLKKIGGRDRFGNGYKSRWVVKIASYGIIIRFLAELGHTVKDLQQVEFPPAPMRHRLEAIAARRAKKALTRFKPFAIDPSLPEIKLEVSSTSASAKGLTSLLRSFF